MKNIKETEQNDTTIDATKNIDKGEVKNKTISQNNKNRKYDKFTIVNWNIGGAKYLQEVEGKREKTKASIHNELIELIHAFKPDIITLQEVVKYRSVGDTEKKDIIKIEKINEEIQRRYTKEWINENIIYDYFPLMLVESTKQSSEAKWKKVIKHGKWYLSELPPNSKEEELSENEIDDLINKVYGKLYFAQGNAFLIRRQLPRFAVWDLSKLNNQDYRISKEHGIEQVNLENGLYFGDRDTEPRAALVAHFILNPKNNIKGKKSKLFMPYDVFVINLHLTTLMGEREGIPEIDIKASNIRENQLRIVFDGIISRYNNWKRIGYKIRNKNRKEEKWETYERHEPLWIIAGDFNFTPESDEYRKIVSINFKDVIPNKKNGTKSKGVGKKPTLSLDYIFAGPKFIALDPIIIDNEINANSVHDHYKSSDHKPMDATIPIVIPKPDEAEDINTDIRIKEVAENRGQTKKGDKVSIKK